MFGLSPITLLLISTGQKDSHLELMEKTVHGRPSQDKMRRDLQAGMMLVAWKLFTMERFMLCVKD